MSNSVFSFKKFTVHHDRCAMKVGTDGVLIGAWANVFHAKHILDIGSGTGLIALMAAQRSQASIVGIEIDQEAAIQAQENVRISLWKERIRIIHADLKAFKTDILFDSIISNPPYFSNSLKCPDNKRNIARHDNGLSFQELVRYVAKLLHPQGEFSIIIPACEVNKILGFAIENKLYPSRKTWIQTTPKVSPKRCMLAFRFTSEERVEEKTLIIETAPSIYSEEYKKLTQDFYLKM